MWRELVCFCFGFIRSHVWWGCCSIVCWRGWGRGCSFKVGRPRSRGWKNVESAKWCACALASFVCFTCLACSRAWGALVLGVLDVLACLTGLHAWRASWNGVLGVLQNICVLGVLQNISVFGVLHKMASLACLVRFMKLRAWRAS